MQNVSGVFVCLMESLILSVMPDPDVGEVRLVSVYYLILIMAGYLVSFDLLYALPCCVRQLSLMLLTITDQVIFRITISTTSTNANRKLIQSQQTTCSTLWCSSYHTL